MKLALIVLLGLSLSLSAAEKKRKSPKPPDISILQTAAHRSEGKIALDGRIRNSGEKTIEGLVLLFDFMAPGRSVITTQKSRIDEEVLAPGEEAVFHVELNDPVRAVEYQLAAVDRADRELRVANAGPFVID